MARSKDGRQAKCKECAAAYYVADWTNLITQIRARKKRVILDAKVFVWGYLQSHPCIDCGEADPMVLDFDHVTGTKVANVSSLVANGYSLSAVKREIAKCVVRCANCHRRRTAQQFGWYAWIPTDDAVVA